MKCACALWNNDVSLISRIDRNSKLLPETLSWNQFYNFYPFNAARANKALSVMDSQ